MNLKKYLPIENYTLITKLSVEEIMQRLTQNVEPRKNVRMHGFGRKSLKPYEGEITTNSFKISRIIDSRNSFLPMITGNISSFLGKTEIKIKMQPATFVLIFISLWLGIVGIVCLGMAAVALAQISKIFTKDFSPMTFIPFAMFIFGCLLTHFAFKSESKKSKQFLERIFEATEINSD